MTFRFGRTIRIAASIVRNEGPRAFADRAADRTSEWRRRRGFPPAPHPLPAVSMVNLLGTPPAPRLGGVQTQLLHRLAREARSRTVALLYPDGNALRLDIEQSGNRMHRRFPAARAEILPLRDAGFEDAVSEALRRTGARALHVENPAGLPLESLARLAQSAPLVLSVHDFSPICARTDLLERPRLRFCGYCDDDRRCAACLGREDPPDAAFAREHRLAGRALLGAAAATVFPSRFLRDTLVGRVPGIDPARLHVIPPDPPRAIPDPQRASARPVRHVAFVGAVTVQKGAREFADVVREIAPRFPGVRWSAIGKGDRGELASLRRQGGIRIRGYYRSGALPAVLARERVDLALALSVTPESYGLTVDECLAAGVPVLAFDHGAIPERLRGRGGWLVAPERGARGIAEVLAGLLAAGRALPAPRPAEPADAAAAHLALYRSLGLLPPPSAPAGRETTEA